MTLMRSYLAFKQDEILAAIKALDAKVDDVRLSVNTLGVRLMATLDDVVTKVAALKTVEDSVKALLADLSARIRALEPNQAAIDQLANDVDAQIADLTQAVTDNTPAAPQ